MEETKCFRSMGDIGTKEKGKQGKEENKVMGGKGDRDEMNTVGISCINCRVTFTETKN